MTPIRHCVLIVLALTFGHAAVAEVTWVPANTVTGAHIGASIGRGAAQVGQAIAQGQRAADDINARTRNARAAFFQQYPDGPRAQEAAREFADVLFANDTGRLHNGLMERAFSNIGGAGGLAMQATGANRAFNAGITPGTFNHFKAWENAVLAKLPGRVENLMMRPTMLNDALAAAMPEYQQYAAFRDYAEFHRAGRLDDFFPTAESWMQFVIRHFDGKSTPGAFEHDLTITQSQALDRYRKLVGVYGHDAVREVAGELFEADHGVRAFLQSPEAVGVPSTYQNAVEAALYLLAQRGDTRQFAVTHLVDRRLWGLRTRLADGEARYEAIVEAHGYRAVSTLVDELRDTEVGARGLIKEGPHAGSARGQVIWERFPIDVDPVTGRSMVEERAERQAQSEAAKAQLAERDRQRAERQETQAKALNWLMNGVLDTLLDKHRVAPELDDAAATSTRSTYDILSDDALVTPAYYRSQAELRAGHSQDWIANPPDNKGSHVLHLYRFAATYESPIHVYEKNDLGVPPSLPELPAWNNAKLDLDGQSSYDWVNERFAMNGTDLTGIRDLVTLQRERLEAGQITPQQAINFVYESSAARNALKEYESARVQWLRSAGHSIAFSRNNAEKVAADRDKLVATLTKLEQLRKQWAEANDIPYRPYVVALRDLDAEAASQPQHAQPAAGGQAAAAGTTGVSQRPRTREEFRAQRAAASARRASGDEAASTAAYQVGQVVDADMIDGPRSSWSTAIVLEVRDDRYHVSWDDYYTHRDRWVTADEIRPNALTDSTPDPNASYQVGDKINVRWKRRAYAATIVEVKPNAWRVHWDGYSDSYNQKNTDWVGAHRIVE